MKSKINETFAGLFSGGEDRGVSPVIGVILMVAITVILAAVIGAFVLGLGGDMSTGVQAGANIGVSGDTATITWNSGGNADELSISVSDEANLTVGNNITAVGGTSDVVVDSGVTKEVTITVTAHNADESAVVSQETVTLEG